LSHPGFIGVYPEGPRTAIRAIREEGTFSFSDVVRGTGKALVFRGTATEKENVPFLATE
jgi:hypothetical protein